jgi:hypothetical protein
MNKDEGSPGMTGAWSSPLLPPDRCLWMVERNGAWQICNGWPVPGSSYCAEHAALAEARTTRTAGESMEDELSKQQ